MDCENWGLIGYEEALLRQRQIQAEVIAGSRLGCVVFCEHPPTVTAGSSTQDVSFLQTREQMAGNGISFFKVERGGDLTFHGPGQLVCYPLLNLNTLRRDVHWYMRALEGAIIATCAQFGVATERIAGRTGVWIVQPEGVKDSVGDFCQRRKIASIGVRLSRWCSMHGLALNVRKQDARAVQAILPCGLADIKVTSIVEELELTGRASEFEVNGGLQIDRIADILMPCLAKELGF